MFKLFDNKFLIILYLSIFKSWWFGIWPRSHTNCSSIFQKPQFSYFILTCKGPNLCAFFYSLGPQFLHPLLPYQGLIPVLMFECPAPFFPLWSILTIGPGFLCSHSTHWNSIYQALWTTSHVSWSAYKLKLVNYNKM